MKRRVWFVTPFAGSDPGLIPPKGFARRQFSVISFSRKGVIHRIELIWRPVILQRKERVAPCQGPHLDPPDDRTALTRRRPSSC